MELPFTSSVMCSLAGLLFDIVGAGLLAYDMVIGPGARFQARYAQIRLEGVRKFIADKHQHVRELPDPPYTPALKEEILAKEVPPLEQSAAVAEQELRLWQAHENRAQNHALLGLLPLMFGFSLQGAGVILGILK